MPSHRGAAGASNFSEHKAGPFYREGQGACLTKARLLGYLIPSI